MQTRLRTGLLDPGAGGIVQIAEGNDAGTRGDGAADIIGIDGEVILCAAGEAPDDRPEQAGGMQQGIVGGLLDEYLVAGIEESRECKMISERGANGGHNTGGRDSGTTGQALDQQRIAVGRTGAEFQFLQIDGKITE